MEQLFPRRGPSLDPLSIYHDLDLPHRGANGLPFVYVNMVSSVDGKITLDGDMAGKKSIGSRVDSALMRGLRLHADVVVRGAQTVRANPQYPVVYPEMEALRSARNLPHQPLAAIVTGTADLPLESKLFTQAPRRPIVITGQAAPADRLRRLREAADVHVLKGERVAPADILTLLAEMYGVRRVLLEGGPNLNYDFLRDGLVDEYFWTIAPRMIGKENDLTAVEGPRLFDPLISLEPVAIYHHEGELFTRYRVLKDV